MKTLHLAIIVMTTIPLFSIVLPIEAQCYGCGQNSSALKQGLLEKQLGLTGPPRNTNDISIQDILVQPTAIRVGDTFAINATLVNNSPNTITVKNGCGGPFSIVFDSHAMVEVKKVCNWMAPQIILDPGENIIGTSMASNLDYKAVAPGTVNATVTFSYIVGNKTNLSFDNNSTDISKSFLFAISDLSSQTTPVIPSPLEQFKSGITVTDVKCSTGYALTIKSEDGSPACVKPSTVRIMTERGWAKFESAQANHASNAKTNPFGIAGLIIYYGGGPCGAGTCPLNTFNLKITSNYTAYLLGYNICDGNICAKNDNMTTLLPISNVSFPNFKTIALPEDLNWKYKDTMHIQVMASTFPENETATSIDLGNSTTFP